MVDILSTDSDINRSQGGIAIINMSPISTVLSALFWSPPTPKGKMQAAMCSPASVSLSSFGRSFRKDLLELFS